MLPGGMEDHIGAHPGCNPAWTTAPSSLGSGRGHLHSVELGHLSEPIPMALPVHHVPNSPAKASEQEIRALPSSVVSQTGD